MNEKDLQLQDVKSEKKLLEEKVKILQEKINELQRKLISKKADWISDRKPVERNVQFLGKDIKESDMVWVTVEDPQGKRTVDLDKTRNGIWEYYSRTEYKIVAWMQRVPEPYKED